MALCAVSVFFLRQFSGIKNIPQSCWQDQQFSAGYCHGKVDIYISLYILCL